jgi:hypothetical protein
MSDISEAAKLFNKVKRMRAKQDSAVEKFRARYALKIDGLIAGASDGVRAIYERAAAEDSAQ